ncbi:AI-2E family transporter [Aquabacterium sp.]|jgi:predicted PurR-regulated permease PerM|uniref:AI-2E family transporter n=1 Tax=Aquabacterium sp. TaxID=1872578 RepID=UPI0025BCAB10|nr:AI-2E family transporter [Aquabacterium sp.]
MTTESLTKPRLAWAFTGLALAALLWWHAAILTPFALSLVLAYALRPGVDRLVLRARLPRALAVGLCLLMVVLVLATVLVLLVPIVSELTPMLRKQLPDLLVGLWSRATPWLAQWGVVLPSSAEDIKLELLTWAQDHASQLGAAALRSLLVGGGGLVSLAGLALLVPMLAFYWLLDWDRLMARLVQLVPLRWRQPGHALIDECDELMGQYLRGQVMVMGILAVYYAVALSLAGFKLGLPIGVFTGLAICIPYLGFGLGLVLALLAGLLQFGAGEQGASYALGSVALVYGLGQVVESFFLTPRLVGERIGLHPLGVILALMLFGQWLGVWGVLIALPVSALAVVLGRRALLAYQASGFFKAP